MMFRCSPFERPPHTRRTGNKTAAINMTLIRQQDFIQGIADALQFISYQSSSGFPQGHAPGMETRAESSGQGCEHPDPGRFADVRRGSTTYLPGHGDADVLQVLDGRSLGGPTQSHRDGRHSGEEDLPASRQHPVFLQGGRSLGQASRHQRQHTGSLPGRTSA